MKIADIFDYLDSLAPFCEQEAWDNSGLNVGDREREISSLTLALDVTAEALCFAEKMGDRLIVSHHPCIFTPIKSFTAGNIAFEAAQRGIALLSAHTNLDKASVGTGSYLAKLLGLGEIESFPEVNPYIRIGKIKKTTAAKLGQRVASLLNTNVELCCGEAPVERLAIVTGAGGDFFNAAADLGADCLLTGEAKYHELLDAAAMHFPLLTAGHFATEFPILEFLKASLNEKFPQLKINIFTPSKGDFCKIINI